MMVPNHAQLCCRWGLGSKTLIWCWGFTISGKAEARFPHSEAVIQKWRHVSFTVSWWLNLSRLAAVGGHVWVQRCLMSWCNLSCFCVFSHSFHLFHISFPQSCFVLGAWCCKTGGVSVCFHAHFTFLTSHCHSHVCSRGVTPRRLSLSVPGLVTHSPEAAP